MAGDIASVGFVGAGAMGGPIIKRIAAAGYDVVAVDLDPERLREIRNVPRVHTTSSVHDLADVAVAICMLPSSAAVAEVVAGPGGLLQVMSIGSLIIDMGSSDPASTVALSASAAQVEIDLVDAPVSGGVAGAHAGRLTVMFGGSADQLERCRNLLEALSARIISVGPTGSGHAMKALNNILSAVGLAAASEVMEIGTRFGLDPETMLEVLNASTGRNNATETKVGQFILSGIYASGFGLRLMLKDISTAVDIGRRVDVHAPLAEACLDLWQHAADDLPADADQTRIADYVRALHRPARSVTADV